jgi:two-component system response regulator (stage 0 sporulation protein A)
MESKTRVIIADAGEEYRMLLYEILTSEGDFEVAGCTGDGLTAFSLVRTEKPDVLLTDLILTGLDGLAVLEKISELPDSERPAVIIISAFSSEHTLMEASNLGASYFMQKPCDIPALLTRIRMVSGKHARPARWSPRRPNRRVRSRAWRAS